MPLFVSDLEELGQSALAEFSQGVAQIGRAGERDLELQVQRLEARLEQLYAVATTMAQREETLEAFATIWARMVEICDAMAASVSDLLKGRAARSASHDRILDIRNACEENRALHAGSRASNSPSWLSTTTNSNIPFVRSRPSVPPQAEPSRSFLTSCTPPTPPMWPSTPSAAKRSSAAEST
jgi:hypothetical protein